MADEDTTGLTGDAKIVAEAKKRFEYCQAWEADYREKEGHDLKFANGDPDNNWQWEEQLRTYRQDRNKPCLTINKVRQHNLQVINDAKQNKPGVSIRPVGDGATYEAAQVFEGVVRHIEYISNAEVAYDTATTFQVESGTGYWRVVHDYLPDSFDQEIYIRRIKDPDSVYLDPDINEVDGSDARYGFVFEDVPRDEFEKQYPKYKEDGGSTVLGSASDGWVSSEHVRVAEYYTKEQKRDRLVAFIDPFTGAQIIKLWSKLPPGAREIYDQQKEADPAAVSERSVLGDHVMWYKIAGNKIVDRRECPGTYIPIVRVIGEETIIDGKMDRKGHTRYMKDAQRMYNYWSSEATAQVALQTKTPWVVPAEGIENLEEYWSRANVDNSAVLPYNMYTENGQLLVKPERVQPPVMATAYVQGMQITQNEMMMSSGQYQSQFGQNENATSGRAINERQRQGDNATYHFIDNLGIGIRFTGKILIQWIPLIYDTQRVVKIMAKDGTESEVQIDPQQPSAVIEQQVAEKEASVIFNPSVGRYEVQADVGPGYATRRQEAFNAMTQIAAQNKEFMQIGGDLLWKAADFPMADELAERWQKTIPPALLGDGPNPAEQKLGQQLDQAMGMIEELQAKLKDQEVDKAVKVQDSNIRGFDAETKRITAIGNSGPYVTMEQVQPLIMQTIMQMLGNGAAGEGGLPMPAANMSEPAPMPPMGQNLPPDSGFVPEPMMPGAPAMPSGVSPQGGF